MWAIFQAIKRSWSQHFVAQFSGLTIMTLTYSAVLFIAMAMFNVQGLFDTWGKVNKLTIYLNQENEGQNSQKLADYLKKHEMVHSLKLVTSEESAKKFETRFSSLTTGKIDGQKLQSFFPEFYEVSLNESMAYKSGFGSLDSFAAQLSSQFSVVKSISYGKAWLNRYISLLSVIKTVAWCLIFLFIIAGVVVSSNVIKTLLFAKKEEIEILEFVGADDTKIYLPQVINILILASLSFSLSCFFNFAILYGVTTQGGQVLSPQVLNQLTFVPPIVLVALFLICISAVFVYSLLNIYQMMPRRKKALVFKEPLA